MGHIKRRMQEGDPKVACFRMDAEGTLWFKERLVVPKRSFKEEDSGWSPHIKLFHSSWEHKDVSWPKE
jgi:hypothetical protein